jgi:hypothetical protein
MKKDTSKNAEIQVLELLKKVLPKATHDAELAGKIYAAIEDEFKKKARGNAFHKFCQRVELPDLEPKSIEALQKQLKDSFREADITLQPNRKEKVIVIELALQDGSQFTGEIKVGPKAAAQDDGEPEVTLKFIPFPVSLPGDKELVWMLAKRENLSPDEAGIALTKLQEDFWGSKTGQKLLRDRVERNFPEFIARVPGGMLNEAGLKRHYKTPEPLKVLRVTARG